LKKILFFSNNEDKVYEIKNLFYKHKMKLSSLNDYKTTKAPKETGKSFVENAKIKSEFGYKLTNLPCFADDSGLCIESMGGKPGIFSKRFMSSFKNKNECLKYIINKSRHNNKAFFQTSICLTLKQNYHIVFNGKINGIISKSISGEEGFGYDPIFIPDGFKKTFSSMSLIEKNSISHRSIAIRKLINFLSN